MPQAAPAGQRHACAPSRPPSWQTPRLTRQRAAAPPPAAPPPVRRLRLRRWRPRPRRSPPPPTASPGPRSAREGAALAKSHGRVAPRRAKGSTPAANAPARIARPHRRGTRHCPSRPRTCARRAQRGVAELAAVRLAPGLYGAAHRQPGAALRRCEEREGGCCAGGLFDGLCVERKPRPMPRVRSEAMCRRHGLCHAEQHGISAARSVRTRMSGPCVPTRTRETAMTVRCPVVFIRPFGFG